MSAYDPSHWADFALAQLGASAALLGLVFVGLSINLKDVIGSRPLVNRAGEAVIALGSLLIASTAVLIPHQSHGALAAELVVIAGFTFSATFRLQVGAETQIAAPDERGPPPRLDPGPPDPRFGRAAPLGDGRRHARDRRGRRLVLVARGHRRVLHRGTHQRVGAHGRDPAVIHAGGGWRARVRRRARRRGSGPATWRSGGVSTPHAFSASMARSGS
jgi:hypothetical protein